MSVGTQLRQTFTNALVYTVCAEIVQKTINASNTSSLIILIVLFAILIVLVQSILALLPENATTTSHSVYGVSSFLVSLILNVVVQFESTLVARVSVAVLSPSSAHTAWMIAYACMSLVLMWLLEQSTVGLGLYKDSDKVLAVKDARYDQ